MKCGTVSLNKGGLLAVGQAEFCNILYTCKIQTAPQEQLTRDSPQQYRGDLPVIFRIQSSIDQSHVGMNQLFNYVHSHNRKMGEVTSCPQ